MKTRLLVLFLLGFSSGLPFCLVGSTLQAWFSVNAFSVMTVGMLGLIGQPYIYKFFWAPLFDRYAIGHLERRRGWIFLLQAGLILLFLFSSFFNPGESPWLIASIALIIAFFSASQDTVIDAYRTEILPEKERGLGASFAVAGYRIGILISGGLALIIAQYCGWAFTYRLMAVFMLLGVIGNYFAPLVKHEKNQQPEKINLWLSLKAFFHQENAWLFILFIFLYKLAEAFTSTNSSLIIPFLIQTLHFDLASVGLVNKIGGIIAATTGSVVAGVIMLRWTLFRALFVFGIVQAFSVLFFLNLAIHGNNMVLLTLAVVMDNLAVGMSTTALLALMMSLCEQRFTATHFAFLSAVAALPRMIAGPVGGLLQSIIGWKWLFLCVFFAAWPALILLNFLKKRV